MLRLAHEANGAKGPPPCPFVHPRTVEEHVARQYVLAYKRQRARETPAAKRQRVHKTMLALCRCTVCTLAGTRHYIS